MDLSHELSEHTLRLRLRPKAPASGYVDGAWWPHSHDLSAELPSLLAVLNVRLGRVERVSYHLADWSAAPRRVNIDGDMTRLGGFTAQSAHTVDMIAADGRRLTLLVVPPDTDESAAHGTMMNASQRDNTDTIAELMA
ncbi:DUF5994 family protein [Actinokineospora sp. HUAS TT18]|uniref:DUF5994 family protein n=1 Tax=Actinokineospora sp. HUAS TT18 TaxID=3447451 RepID=UPI003F5230FB